MTNDVTPRVKQKTPWPVVNEHNLDDNTGPGERIKVRCIDPRGLYYGGSFQRIHEGDIFTLVPRFVTVMDPKTEKPVMESGQPKKQLIAAIDQFSEKTMELVDDPTAPDSMTSAQEHLNRVQDDLNDSKTPRKR